MEVYELPHDLITLCVTAESFPNEIDKAFTTLISKLPGQQGRTFFGIAYQDESGKMIYRAAALALHPDEGLASGCEAFIIQKGKYLTEYLTNWKRDESSIGKTFRRLGDARPDTAFPCIEWYKGEDVLCMVRLE